MAQVSMTVRMDAGLKAAFDSLCQQFGMSSNAAMNIFANAVVKTRSIPFKITAYPTEDNEMKDYYDFRREVAASDRPELTMEEINEEIRLAREEIAAKKK
ncbi:MAG: type II toxin-antitoxin system RelB/DinJ family antitoxin [Bacteroidales bacterium]|nr:type II toxin-antitoxin system RelB/DinJ family antitoxin [Bacteroidales bacterium]